MTFIRASIVQQARMVLARSATIAIRVRSSLDSLIYCAR